MGNVEYDEFGLFHENAEEFGLPFDAPPVVRREFVETRPGHRLSALVWGTTEPELVLLHGGGGHAETYSRNMTRLAKVCQPHAIDFIWHGMSSRPAFSDGAPRAKENWLTQFTDQLLNLMDHMGIEKAVVEGESLGGWIAADLATKIPERINRLALIAPMGVKLGSEEQLDIPDLFVARPEAVERMTFADPQKARLDYASMTDEELGRIARDRETHTLLVWEPYMHSAKLRHRLHRLRMPSLFLRGAQDGVVSADYLSGYAGLAPDARVETIPAAGHLPQFEQAEATASIIESFLTRAGA